MPLVESRSLVVPHETQGDPQEPPSLKETPIRRGDFGRMLAGAVLGMVVAVGPANAQTTETQSWQFAVTAYGYLPTAIAALAARMQQLPPRTRDADAATTSYSPCECNLGFAVLGHWLVTACSCRDYIRDLRLGFD